MAGSWTPERADAELIERAQADDSEALAALFDRHRQRLARMVRLRMDRRLQGRLDETDVLQEAFLVMQKRLPEYAANPAVAFFVWLRTLTCQALIDAHRFHLGAKMRDARQELTLHPGGLPQVSSVSLAAQLIGKLTTASRAVARAELQVTVQEILNRLEPVDREVLALRHFEQCSNAEVAEVLGIQESAASKRYVRALQRLKQQLVELPGFLDQLE